MISEYVQSSSASHADLLALMWGVYTGRATNHVILTSNEIRSRYNPDAFIGLELSLVPEVESVYVDLPQQSKTVRVITIINERNPAARERIYRREQAIMDAFQALDFDFRVIVRKNRDLAEVVDQVGAIAFRRR